MKVAGLENFGSKWWGGGIHRNLVLLDPPTTPTATFFIENVEEQKAILTNNYAVKAYNGTQCAGVRLASWGLSPGAPNSCSFCASPFFGKMPQDDLHISKNGLLRLHSKIAF